MQVLCEYPDLSTTGGAGLWGKLLDALLQLLERRALGEGSGKHREGVNEDEAISEEAVGYTAAFAPLHNAARPAPPLPAELCNPKAYLATSLARFSQVCLFVTGNAIGPQGVTVRPDADFVWSLDGKHIPSVLICSVVYSQRLQQPLVASKAHIGQSLMWVVSLCLMPDGFHVGSKCQSAKLLITKNLSGEHHPSLFVCAVQTQPGRVSSLVQGHIPPELQQKLQLYCQATGVSIA